VQLGHANEAEVSEIRLTVGVALGERKEVRQVLAAVERTIPPAGGSRE